MQTTAEVDGKTEQQCDQDTRHYPGQEQGTDGLLGNDGIHDEHHTRRYQHPQAAAGGHHPAGQLV